MHDQEIATMHDMQSVVHRETVSKANNNVKATNNKLLRKRTVYVCMYIITRWT